MNKRLLFMVTLMLQAFMIAAGQKAYDSKTLTRSFRTESDPVVEVTNKYGDIHVTLTGSDSVIIRVEITASSATGDKISNMISGVDISFSETGGRIKAETSFRKGVTPLIESVKNLTRNLISYDSRLKIDYRITCPHNTELRIDNRYGDVFLADDIRRLTLKLANGALDAVSVSEIGMMELAFSKANIRTIGQGRVSLSFSELRTREAEELRLTSISSKVWLDRFGIADVESKRDLLNLGTGRSVRGNSYFSDIVSEQLSDEISLTARYGTLTFRKIEKGFSTVDLHTSWADTDLVVEAGASYELEIRENNASLHLTGFTPAPERSELNLQEKLFITRARTGDAPRPSLMRIETSRGELRLMQK